MEGNGGVYDSGDSCQNGIADGLVKNSNHCDAGYYDGFYGVAPKFFLSLLGIKYAFGFPL
jgi:hypothetical protein